MENFSVKDYWINRYFNGGSSGWGSHDMKSVKFKSDYINGVIKKYKVDTVCELGCGDGFQLGHFSGYKEYHGYDIAWTIITRCKLMYLDDKTKFFYYSVEEVLNRKFDMALSLDVIYHLVEDDMYQEYMKNLFSLSDLVCIFSNDKEIDKSLESLPHLKNRMFTKYVSDTFPDFKLMENKRFYEVKISENNVGFYLYIKEKQQ